MTPSIRTLQTSCTRLKSGPTVPDSTLSRGGFWCRCMSPRFQTRFRCQRAPSSPRALWHRACHPSGNGSDVATCPAAPDLSPAREGSDVTTCLRHQDHRPTGLQYHHMSCGSRPASRCGRALEPPRALWPSAPEACPCVSKTSGIRLIMASPGTWSIQFIKCVQDKTYAAYG
jgi:hypothetical protein